MQLMLLIPNPKGPPLTAQPNLEHNSKLRKIGPFDCQIQVYQVYHFSKRCSASLEEGA